MQQALALQTQGLTKCYPKFTLRDVSLRLPRGCIMGVIGDNGAGKTTLFKLLLGLTARDGGDVSLLGQPMGSAKADAQIKQHIGVVLGGNNWPPRMKGTQVSRVLAEIYTDWDAGYFAALLVRFRVDAQKSIQALSRGMRMKLGLAAALAARPELLLLDEPAEGLDPVAREELNEVLLEFIGDERHSILVSSHITGDLEKICDYICVLHEGQVLLCEEKDALLTRMGLLRCDAAALETVAGDLLRVRRGQYGCEALVQNAQQLRLTHPQLLIDPVTLEEMMVLFAKGETR